MMIEKKFKCVDCGKEYIRETVYEKHRLWCMNVDKSKEKEMEYREWSNQSELRDLLREMIRAINILKKDVEGLKKNLQIKKKKINLLEWLKENKRPEKTYKEIFNSLIITREDLKKIFKSDIIEGIKEILEDLIKKEGEKQKIKENNKDIGIISFDIKENEIYVFSEERKWEILSFEEFKNVINPIIKNILSEFKKWQDENEDKLLLEDFSIIYLENVKKVMGGNLSLENQLKKIHKNFYLFLKVTLQNTFQYEFI